MGPELQIFGCVTPGTGSMSMTALGNGACGTRLNGPGGGAVAGCHETTRTVIEVTVMVLPRVHAGNLDADMLKVSI